MSSNAKKRWDIITGPYQISIDVTNKCNLRCLHCYNYSGENICIQNELSDEEILNLITDLCDMKPYNVCICGGEPLLRKELVIDIVKMLSNNNIKCSMVSNGILLDDDTAFKLKKAWIFKVQISLDGLEESHDRLRGVSGVFEKAIKALEALKKQKIGSGIAFSPTPWNINDFNNVVDLALKLDVEEVRIQALMPIGRGSLNSNELIPSNEQYRLLMKYINESKKRVKKLGSNLNIQWGDPIDHLIRFPEQIESTPTIAIRANGNIAPSVYLPISVGNIKSKSFKQYWNSGLARVWQISKVREVANNYRSVMEMNIKDKDLPTTFLDEDIYLDIMDKDFDQYIKE